jgi:hypothetical protein
MDPSRNLAATQHLGRFRSEADIASDMDHRGCPREVAVGAIAVRHLPPRQGIVGVRVRQHAVRMWFVGLASGAAREGRLEVLIERR